MSTHKLTSYVYFSHKCSSYRLAEKSCLYCRKVPKQGDQHFCGKACADEAMKKGPLILEVPEDHETFKSGEDVFRNSCSERY